jgi:hypothetical protein
VSVKACAVGYPRRPFIAGQRTHGRIVVWAAVKHLRALFGSRVWPILHSSLAPGLHLARFGSTQVSSARVAIDSESESVQGRGYVPGDQPEPKARLAMGLLCCRLPTGVCTSVFVPPAEIGVRSRRSVWSNTAAKSRVLFWRMAPRWLPIGPTHYESDN